MSGEDISNAMSTMGSLSDILAVLIIVGIIVTALFFGMRSKARGEFSKFKQTNVVDAVNGEVVKLVGRLKIMAPPLKAPLSDRSCAYFHVVVEYQEQEGNVKVWRTLGETTSHHEAFWLDDWKGEALVRLDQAQVIPRMSREYDSNMFVGASPQVEALFRKLNIKDQGYWGRETLRCREGVLKEGDKVVVIGKCQRGDPGSASTERYQEGDEALTVVASDDGVLLVTNDPTVY